MAPSMFIPPRARLGIRSPATSGGGSTITQQLARSLFLKKEDSLRRKLLEAVVAIRIYADPDAVRDPHPLHEQCAAGAEPVRLRLSAWLYSLGVGVRDVNLAEAALLVGMLPEPNNRDPLKHPAAASRGRRRRAPAHG